MHNSIISISKSDYFYTSNPIIEIVKVMTGQDVLHNIIHKITLKNYDNYFNLNEYLIKLHFPNNDSAQMFFSLLSEQDLLVKFQDYEFYAALKECMYCSSSSNIIFSSELYSEKNGKKNTYKLFTPVLKENDIYILVPNTHVVYFVIDQNAMSTILLANKIMYQTAIIYTEQCAADVILKKDNLLSCTIVEKDLITGKKYGIFVVEDGYIYILSDFALNLICFIKKTFIQIYNINNTSLINKYVIDHNEDWEKYYNELLIHQ
jgi:hypothetical protein